MPALRSSAVLVIAAALGLSACGGGSSSGGGNGAGASRNGAATGEHASGTGSGSGGAGAGSSASRQATPSPIGRAGRTTFIHNADRVCRRAHVRLAHLGTQLRDVVLAAGRKRMSIADYYIRASALTKASAEVAARAVTELKGLPRPRDRRLETYLALSTTQTRLLAGEARALRRGDGRAVRQLDARTRQLVGRSRALAHAYGFRECGGG